MEGASQGSQYRQDIHSHRGSEFVFPASLEFMSFPGVYAGVELLVELGPLLGEDMSREYEGAGLALRTRDPPKCWDSDLSSSESLGKKSGAIEIMLLLNLNEQFNAHQTPLKF